jgi:hypothetical protein
MSVDVHPRAARFHVGQRLQFAEGRLRTNTGTRTGAVQKSLHSNTQRMSG